MKQILIILGMHRSGTSVLAGTCRLLGADLGAHLLAAQADNVTGFWEHDDIVRIHDEILESLGYTWEDPRALPKNWWTREVIQPQRAALLGVLRRDFSDAQLPCVKDPRLCRLLPLWHDLLKELRWQPRYLITTRKPADIAASLQARNGFPAEKSVLLTLRYMLDAEAASRGGVRAFIDYSALLVSWRRTLQPAWKHLGLDWPADDAGLDARVAGFIRRELRHHHNRAALRVGKLGRLSERVNKAMSVPAEKIPSAAAFKQARKDLNTILAEVEPILVAEREQQVAIRRALATQEDQVRRLVYDERALSGALEHERSEQARLHNVVQRQQHEFQSETAMRDREIQRLQQAFQEETTARDQEILRLQQVLQEETAARDQEILRLQQVLQEETAARDQEILRLQQVLQEETAARDQEILRLQGEVQEEAAARFREIKRLQHEMRDGYASRDKEIQRQQEEFHHAAAVRDREIERLQQDIQRVQQEFLEERAIRDRQIQGIYSSHSWRITAPLRTLTSGLRHMAHLRHLDRHMLRLWARDLYYRVPLPARLRMLLRRMARRMLGFGPSPVASPHHSGSKLPPAPVGGVDPKLVAAFLADAEGESAVSLPLADRPEVSVVIPVYNKVAYTLHCLRSIVAAGAVTPFEVIVVDDCSSDETPEVLWSCRGVRVLRNAQNLGFIGACNAGARKARGRFVLFLNNDTAVAPGWLDELYRTFQAIPEAGLVGSKLIYPDGRMQEAGGIVWQDGSAWNYGRFDDPGKPEYNYLRDVDFISGASIMVPRELFLRLGGFDSHYAPAYCEDVDLAFQIQRAGLRVLFQPLSVVVHYEGITSGTDLKAGAKQYQVTNLRKLYARWHAALSRHRPNGVQPQLERDRGAKRRILMIDADNLRPDQDAGSAMAWHYLKIFKLLGYKVTFIPDNLVFEGDYTLDLQRIGVECVYSPYCTSINDYLTENARYYDYIILTRPYVGIKYLDLLKQCAPHARIIYSSVDLHYLRERRHAELENNPLLAARAERTRRDELRLILESDAAMVVNQVEKDYLAREVPDANVHVVQIVFEEQPPGPAFEARQDILYIGGYLHPPNVDAVLYFASEILPGIRQRLPGVRFFVLGSNPPLELKALQCEYIVVPGFQADIAPYFNACRLMVAPLRYGAGIKGKLGTSFSYGLPVVATAVAAEGMELHDRNELLIADTPEDFVQSVVELYTDFSLWERLSVAGRQALRDRFSQQAICRDLERVLESAAKRHIALAAG